MKRRLVILLTAAAAAAAPASGQTPPDRDRCGLLVAPPPCRVGLLLTSGAGIAVAPNRSLRDRYHVTTEWGPMVRIGGRNSVGVGAFVVGYLDDDSGLESGPGLGATIRYRRWLSGPGYLDAAVGAVADGWHAQVSSAHGLYPMVEVRASPIRRLTIGLRHERFTVRESYCHRALCLETGRAAPTTHLTVGIQGWWSLVGTVLGGLWWASHVEIGS